MTHELKLREIGNSTGIILPRVVLEQMNLQAGDRVHLVAGPDGTFRLTPYDPAVAEAMEAFRKVHGEYRDAFRELSK
ncbi:MAG: AbrB/MazE/SpoVT family DNA-binding domain-containing protein [Planctomycetes bacterium]|nr:AbrB/MazE/SpoVT family DNA-binding domain-containing protein [Planctomycetota bacterium]